MQCRFRASTDEIYLPTNLSSFEIIIVHKRVKTLNKNEMKKKDDLSIVKQSIHVIRYTIRW